MAPSGYRVCSVCGQRVADAVSDSRAGRASGPGGGGLPGGLSCRNSWCETPDRPLEAVFSVGCYTGALRRAIVGYKYGADLRWARPFGGLLHGFLGRHATWFEEYGVLCPVPSFTGPGARRSWGHVELVCAELSRLAGGEWPVEALVSKTVETEPMSARPHPVRCGIAHHVLSRALALPDVAAVEGRRIVVVDDVCASGQTLLAVARALREGGAEEVAGLVLARAAWRHGRSPARPRYLPSP